MITDLYQPVFDPCEEHADVIMVHYEPRAATQGDSMSIFRRLLKWFGLLSTLVLGALAFSPNTFNVPLSLRPWIFLTFIFWLFAYCAGTFNS